MSRWFQIGPAYPAVDQGNDYGDNYATTLAAAALILASASHGADHWAKVPTTKYSLNNKQDALAFADEKMGWYGIGTGAVYVRYDRWRSLLEEDLVEF